jgi:uncharacterized membrane protein
VSLFQKIADSDAHHRLLLSAGLTVAVFAALGGRVSTMAHIFVTWDFFSFCILALMWIRIIRANPQSVSQSAKLQDSSQTAIFVFVVVSACTSLLALAVLLHTAKDLSRAKLNEHILLSAATVICSWVLVHTVFALHYANVFYKACTKEGDGLLFPEEKCPDYMDFAYFSFVIGMTSQVSDVQISSRQIRRLALVHGMVSFAFNVVIVALTINIISGLL